MAKYVFLINWTAQGIADAQDTTERANHAEQVAKKLGGSNLNFIWTIGRYDIVLTCDLPDDEAATLFALQVGRQGAVRTETLRGFTADEMDAMLAKLG
jgi:uncharacterized protein with GYD domain